jgi:hypothetical protein
MTKETKVLTPGAMPNLPTTGTFDSMARAIIHHMGVVYLTSLLARTRGEMAKAGFLGWQAEDGNVLFDIVPHGGDNKRAKSWAYRVRAAGTKPDGGVHVVSFIMPIDEVEEGRRFGTQLQVN